MMVAFNHNVMGKTLGVDFKLYVKRALIAGGAYVIGIHLTGKHALIVRVLLPASLSNSFEVSSQTAWDAL